MHMEGELFDAMARIKLAHILSTTDALHIALAGV
jgi:hypothetical protein